MDPEELIKQASESMRAAIDAAQGRAEEIIREAEQEAQRIRSEAEATAQRARSSAEAEAQRRLDEVRSALDALQGKLAGASEIQPGPVTVPEPEPPAPAEPTPEPPPEPMPPPMPEPTPDPVPEPIPPPGEADPPSPDQRNGDAAARLVAMKLALDGASREDARKQLAAEYDLPDLDALLDEVYSKAGR